MTLFKCLARSFLKGMVYWDGQM